MNKFVLLPCILLALAACSHDNAIETHQIPDIQPDFVQTRFDLQEGFANKRVAIYIDSLVHFNAYLFAIISVAGPEAFFVSYLTRSQHRLIVVTGSMVSMAVNVDTLSLPLGSSQAYYVGLRSVRDSVYITIQDKSFAYN